MEGWENSNGSASYRLKDMVNCCTVWCIPLAFSAQQHCSDNNRGGSTSADFKQAHRETLFSLYAQLYVAIRGLQPVTKLALREWEKRCRWCHVRFVSVLLEG